MSDKKTNEGLDVFKRAFGRSGNALAWYKRFLFGLFGIKR
jgi:hypothetical protein